MRCANRPLLWTIGLALFALAAATGHATETTPPEAAAGENTLAEGIESEMDENLLGDEFADDGGIGLEEGKVNFALQGADVRDFCNWFAERLGINIVLSPKVGGPMNITLKDVPWDIALRKALETHGYVLTVDENGIYTVLTEDEVALEPLKTEVYSLSYAAAETSAVIIKPLLSPRGTVQFESDSNQLIISDVPSQFANIEKVIHRLDTQIDQVLIEVKLVEKTSTDGSDVGIKWSSLENYQIGASDVQREYEHGKVRTDREVVYTNQAFSQRLSPNQGLYVSTVSGNTIQGDPELTIPLEEVVKTTTKTLVLSASDFNVVFSALMREDNTELISNPKIATVDNRTAEINVTRKLPVPNFSYNEETGSYEISDFDEKEVGIKLKITPQVNEDDYITLDVSPEFSTQFANPAFVISGSEITIPIIDTRNANTRVIVKSTETLVIGGLTSFDETINVTRVPLLSRIPIVGNLFKHKATEKVKTDLVIFITPTLVTSESINAASTIIEKRSGTALAGATEPSPSEGLIVTGTAH